MKCNKRQNVAETKPNKHQKVLETIVKNATQMWCSNPIHLRNPLQFLQLSSHCINDVFMEASQVHLAMSLDQRISGNEESERSFSLTKSNSNRKTKVTTIKDCSKRNGPSNMREKLIVEPATSQEVHIEPQLIVAKSSVIDHLNKSEPPPLAFYPKNRGKTQQPIIFSATQPPPLVPIARNFA